MDKEMKSEIMASHPTLTLILVSITSFLTTFSVSSVVVATQNIGSELSLTDVEISWIPTIFILASTMFLIPIGRISDSTGRKKMFIIGTTIFSFGALISTFSTNGVMFLAFRFIQGFGASFIFSTGIAIITSIYPPRVRGKYIGITIASVYIGGTMGPALGGIITQFLGWRIMIFLSAPIGFLVVLLVLLSIKDEWKGKKQIKFDYIGSIIYALALLALIVGFTSLPNIWAIILIALSAGGIIGFILREKRAPDPVLDLSIFKNNRVFLFSNFTIVFFYIAATPVAFIFSIYLEYLRGMNAAEAGLILLVQPLIQAISAIVAGRVSDKHDPRIIASIGIAVALTNFVLFAFLTSVTPLIFIIINLGILGFGFGFFSSPNTNAVMNSVSNKYLGVAGGVSSTMRTTGQTLGYSFFTTILGITIGNAIITPSIFPQIMTSIKFAFILYIAFLVVSLLFSVFRGKKTIKMVKPSNNGSKLEEIEEKQKPLQDTAKIEIESK